jgi:N-acetylglutamate synthase-like GNAT family acetyltransferase
VRIRRARVADAPAIARVMRVAARGARGAYPARTLAAWGSLPALYHAWAMTAGGETYLVAEQAGRALGYAGLRGGEVTALFVRPSAARRGVASALLARIEALARRRGARRLVVDAARSGVAFYRARGFTGGRTVRVPLPGGALGAVRMTKPL